MAYVCTLLFRMHTVFLFEGGQRAAGSACIRHTASASAAVHSARTATSKPPSQQPLEPQQNVNNEGRQATAARADWVPTHPPTPAETAFATMSHGDGQHKWREGAGRESARALWTGGDDTIVRGGRGRSREQRARRCAKMGPPWTCMLFAGEINRRDSPLTGARGRRVCPQ
jgi:hypothetical protein